MLINNKIVHVYFMPGMAANPSIFEHIKLPEDKFRIHWLEWLIPEPNESLKEYALRMNSFIEHDNIALIGVSFGGMVVQEMSKYLKLKRLIIISSVKSRRELPRRMRYASNKGLVKFIPTSLLNHIDKFEKLAFGDFLKKRAELYKKYLSIRDVNYVDWALKNMINWDRKNPIPGIVHIHGDQDIVFPYKYINGCITVKGGTHIMVVNRFRWFNVHLPSLILKGKMQTKN
ncbi:hypothetical protein JM83_2790 [Gillisia sp. Hel_I_86]|uniref:alpha/beta hydrolase n=1 Tax=Gillisia sp. Hel_I_86 TaxID=1249981 RepID=UPI00119A23F6|nr:alpha/beta hydrolase [Gillisia sp. Hel_I_86]TVZ27730.1 hypothetical protein JM83_2790 [Gillisia sp. Hel_I_86]